jgi:hypothetical protein
MQQPIGSGDCTIKRLIIDLNFPLSIFVPQVEQVALSSVERTITSQGRIFP